MHVTSGADLEVDRRRLLLGAAGSFGLAGLAGCATSAGLSAGPSIGLAPIRAHADRLFDITVCLRPFRAAGPRLDTEQIGDALVVHNYGHGGAGFTLSWGCALEVFKVAASSR